MSEIEVNDQIRLLIVNRSAPTIQVKSGGVDARLSVINKSDSAVGVVTPAVESVRLVVTNKSMPIVKVHIPAFQGARIVVRVPGIQGINGIDAGTANALIAGAVALANNVQNNLNTHLINTANPHQVTAAQIGAELAGAALAAQAFAIQRANHTGMQAQSTIDGLIAEFVSIDSQFGLIDTALDLKADLVNGLVPTSQLPAIAITEFLGNTNSQAQMLALVGQQGDWTIRTDQSLMFILTGSNPAILGNWTAMPYPAAAVTSVNGQVGVVVLAKIDVGLGNVDNTSDINKPVSTAQAAADTAVLVAAASNALVQANLKVEDQIVNGVIDKAPSQNAVFDALALKVDSVGNISLVIQDATTARTAAITDNNKIIEFTNAAAINYTIVANATVALPVGAILIAQQGSTGQVTFVAGAGVTFETSDTYKTRGTKTFIAMKHASLNQWDALGDLESLFPGVSVLARAANSVGAPAPLVAAADGQALVRRSGALGFYKLSQNEVNGLKLDFASSVLWTINHNFGRQVGVSVYTVGGVLIVAEIINVSVNQVTVNFDTATAGYAVVL